MGSPGSSRVRGGGRANWAGKCWNLSPERHSSGLKKRSVGVDFCAGGFKVVAAQRTTS